MPAYDPEGKVSENDPTVNFNLCLNPVEWSSIVIAVGEPIVADIEPVISEALGIVVSVNDLPLMLALPGEYGSLDPPATVTEAAQPKVYVPSVAWVITFVPEVSTSEYDDAAFGLKLLEAEYEYSVTLSNFNEIVVL